MDRKIIAIRKDGGNHYNPNEAISDYKYIDQTDGNIYFQNRGGFVKWIELGNAAFVTDKSTYRNVYCYVNESSQGTKFLQTYSDGTYTNNLLELPEF